MNNSPTPPPPPTAGFFCVSLNSAVDTRLVLDEFLPGRVNRAKEVHRTPGGKGAHVAMALKALGANPTWIGFSGGCSGSELLTGLRALGLAAASIPTSESSRVNLEIISNSNQVTEILEPGPTITSSEWCEFQGTYSNLLQSATTPKVVTISGSFPPGLPPEAAAVLIKSARSAKCTSFIDSSGPPLAAALSAQPDFVKINREEAESITLMQIASPSEAAQATRKLLDLGAKAAIVSLGDRGMVGVAVQKIPAIHAWTAPMRAKSAVGSGDAALAGLAFAIASGMSFDQSLALAVACGAANCLAPLPARITAEDAWRLKRTVHLDAL
jgi:1-phosphofructokinase family hexose kinase